jgi:hypothetical protein
LPHEVNTLLINPGTYGYLGPITLGSSKQDFINAFGSDYRFGYVKNICMIKYDWFEFFYQREDELIYGIQYEPMESPLTNPLSTLNLQQSIDYLNAENIPHTTNKTNLITCTKSQVNIDFDESDSRFSGIRLYKF